MIGTRGVPAAYGGFETAVEEIGRRLVDARARGHRLLPARRRAPALDLPRHEASCTSRPSSCKTAETLSHTGFSVAHAVTQRTTGRGLRLQRRQRPLPAGPARARHPRRACTSTDWSGSAPSGARTGSATTAGPSRCRRALGRRPHRRRHGHRRLLPRRVRRADRADPLRRQDPQRRSHRPARGARPRARRLPPRRRPLRAREPRRRHRRGLPAAARRPSRLVVVGSAPYAAAYTQRIRTPPAAIPASGCSAASTTRTCSTSCTPTP